MNPSLSAALVFLLLVGGWLLGRRRSRPFLRSTDTDAVVALNRAQIERLREGMPVALERMTADPAAPQPSAEQRGWSADLTPLPAQPRLRRERLRQLHAWLRGSPEQRLAAMAVASRSGGRDLLPLLRRGLRDPDPAVMAAAAAAMQRFRGRTPSRPLQPMARPLPPSRSQRG